MYTIAIISVASILTGYNVVALSLRNRPMENLEIDTRIVGGYEVQPHSFPFAVYLELTKPNGRYQCGGALISPNYVLTAAHCLDGVQSVDVVLGVHNNEHQEPGQQRITVSPNDFIRHERYDMRSVTHDIALIRLPQPIRESSTIKYATLVSGFSDFSEKRATGIGWGLSNTGQVSPVLKGVNLRVISKTDCQKYGIDGEDKLCTMTSGKDGVCTGDSGSPLVVNGMVVGVVSFTINGSCSVGVPGVYSDVGAHRQWIQANANV